MQLHPPSQHLQPFEQQLFIIFPFYYSINKILNFESKDLFKDYIRNEISSVCSGIEIEFQESPH